MNLLYLISVASAVAGVTQRNFLLFLLLTELVHTSEYVYLPLHSTRLCHTSNFQWQQDVDVHLVVSGNDREGGSLKVVTQGQNLGKESVFTTCVCVCVVNVQLRTLVPGSDISFRTWNR